MFLLWAKHKKTVPANKIQRQKDFTNLQSPKKVESKFDIVAGNPEDAIIIYERGTCRKGGYLKSSSYKTKHALIKYKYP